LIHLPRVVKEIKTVGLYDLVLQDLCRISEKKSLSEEEIFQALKEHPELLKDYMQLNVEYNLSNIHLSDIDTANLSKECQAKAELFNANLGELRELEKYTLDSEQSATLVIIFSIEFFVLFSVQYFIVLLNLKEWQWWIYSLFASSVAFAYWYGKKQSRLYTKNSAIYERLYTKTLDILAELEASDCIKKEDIIIQECQEHV